MKNHLSPICSCASEFKRNAINWFSLAMLVVFSVFFGQSANAQSVRFRTTRIAVTIPPDYSGSAVITNAVTVSGLGGGVVNFDVSGLPAGADYSLTDNNGAPLTSTSVSTNLWLNLFLTNVIEGKYSFSLNASGTAANNILLTLQVARIWNGAADATNSAAPSWSSGSSWLGGSLTPSSDVVFSDLGGQAGVFVNSVLDTDTTIGSLRFSVTNNSTKYHTLLLNPGVKLSVTGTNGFSIFKDFVQEYAGIAVGSTVTIIGTNATLLVSNQNANVSLTVDNQQSYTLDLSALDNFVTDVNRFGIGDYSLWPNFFNLDANQYSGVPRRFVPQVFFARTNIITARYADPYGYTNVNDRHYSLSFLNSEIGGTSTAGIIRLGISNMFLLDSLNFVGGNQQGNVAFNPALLVSTNVVGLVTNFFTNSMVANFRNTNGGRMTMFTVADSGGTNGANSNIKVDVQFGSSGGSVDMLVDQFYIGRDRPLIVQGQNPNYQGFLSMGKGIIDANYAVLGFQEYSGQTNTGTFNGYCEGKLTVSNSAVFKANVSLDMGYCTQTNVNGLGSGGNTTWGQINILMGGTVMANTIYVGRPAHTSLNNNILVDTGSSLVVSNTLADTNISKMVDSLIIQNGSSLTLNIDGTRTTPYVYAASLSVPTAQTNRLIIGSVKNLAALQIPLIYFQSGSATFSSVTMPSGLNGSLIANGPNQLDLLITPSTNNLVWRGYAMNGNWDQTSVNWLDLATGLHTNFQTGDSVTFDDASGFTTTINVADSVLVPTKITMTNTVNHYTFTGSGSLQGGAVLTKTGTNVLEINATTTIAVQVNQGSFIGNSSSQIGAAGVAAGATMDFAGTILSGVTCAGTTTISGNGNGSITVQAGGNLSQLGTFNGSFVLLPGATLYNQGTINNFGSPTIQTNATLVNAGNMNGVDLTVGGTLKDTGAGEIKLSGVLTINGRGTFIPGNADGSSTTTISQAGSATTRARVLMGNGSTNIFALNPDAVSNSKLFSRSVDFGNNNTLSGGGGVILITNVGTGPFAAGQSYQLFGSSVFEDHLFEAGTNTAPVIRPPAPGPGLAWDTATLRYDGYIKIIAVGNASTLGYTQFHTNDLVLFTGYTTNNQTQVVTTNYTTNNVIISTLNWSATNVGWRLQMQNSSLASGLRAGDSNWAYIYPSWWTNQMFVTNSFSTNGNATFFRLVYP